MPLPTKARYVSLLQRESQAMKFALPFLLLILVVNSSWAQQPTDTVSQTALDATRVYAADEKPNDPRLQDPKDLDGYFPMEVPPSKNAWSRRAEKIRRRILVACGLWPMPPRPEVKPAIHGLVDRETYTVERVYFESYPGLFVTGSLYRPKDKPGPHPVVLSPHGHFSNGRFHDHGRAEVINQIQMGAERFEVGGRHPLQARCVQLARMGCVVFHYDMLGYADSQQLSYELVHRHASPRPELEDPAAWGFFTAQAEMRLQSVFGLQTFNSLRAVDFVTSLPDVDPNRIGVTGASGGGTQTMILAALDPRVTVSFPAVMVSTAMQGGCTCENATCLRVGTGNIEFAGLFAPKPQGISYANDWTREFRSKGLPELKQLYDMYEAPSMIKGNWVVGGNTLDLTYFQHNFNYVSRGRMYEWMNEHLKLGIEGPILEDDFDPLTIPELTVWNEQHPKPPGGDEFEVRFLQELSRLSDEQILALTSSPDEFRHVMQDALTTLLATSEAEIGVVTRDNQEKADKGDYWLFRDKIATSESELPVIFLHPKGWNNEVVLWVSGNGKASLMNAEGQVRKEVAKLLEQGYSVIGADLFQQGEYLDTPTEPLTQSRKVANNRDFAGYTWGYNRTIVGQRVHDLLTLLKFVDQDEHGTEKVHVAGIEGAGHIAVLAKALSLTKIEKLAIDDGDFRFANVKSWRDPNFLPGAIKYGDLPAMLAMCQSGSTWVGTSDVAKANAAQAVFAKVDGKPTFIATDSGVTDAVEWLAK